MFKISVGLLGSLLVFLISPHTASGFKPKAAIGWSLAKATCAQSVAYGKTGTIQTRLQNKDQYDSGGTGRCGTLKWSNCGSSGCKKFECITKGGGGGGGGEGSGGGGGSGTGGRKEERTRTSLQKSPEGTGKTQRLVSGKHLKINTVNVNGEYNWILLFDVNNTENIGSMFRRRTYKSIVRTLFETVLTGTLTSALKAGLKFKGDVKVEMVSFNSHFNADATMDMSVKGSFTKRTDTFETFESIIQMSVGPKSNLLLYQLNFDTPGYSRKYISMSSNPDPKPDRSIQSSFYFKSYLKDVVVRVGKHEMDIPDDVVLGYDPNVLPELNLGFQADTTYFAPEWSDVPDDRIYGLQVIVQNELHENLTNIASGENGPKRYIKIKKNSNDGTAISRLLLFRFTDPKETPEKYGFKDCTSNINAGRGVSFLHLCWLSQVLTRGPRPDPPPEIPQVPVTP